MPMGLVPLHAMNIGIIFTPLTAHNVSLRIFVCGVSEDV
jgi:hypothetical protein